MAMDDRKQRVLEAIVALYTRGGEPVGSGLLCQYFDMAVSSATLRNEMAAFAAQYAEVLQKNLSRTAIVCDRDSVIAACGPARKECLEKRVSIPLEKLMHARRVYLHSGRAEDCQFPCEGAARHIHIAVPIIAAGDVAGAVALLSDEKSAVPSAEEQKALAIAAAFLAKQMES